MCCDIRQWFQFLFIEFFFRCFCTSAPFSTSSSYFVILIIRRSWSSICSRLSLKGWDCRGGFYSSGPHLLGGFWQDKRWSLKHGLRGDFILTARELEMNTPLKGTQKGRRFKWSTFSTTFGSLAYGSEWRSGLFCWLRYLRSWLARQHGMLKNISLS